MNVILSYKNFYPKYINFLKSKDNSVIEGGIHIKINYNSPYIDLTTLYLGIPPMCLPFGICQYNNKHDEKNNNKYYLDFSFSGIEKNNDLKVFYNKLEELDNTIINYVLENKDLFQDYIDYDKNIVSSYVPQIRYNINKITNEKSFNFPPTIKIKLSKNEDDNFKIDFRDNNNNPLNGSEKDIKGSKASGIIECNGIWFANKKFGITWKLIKLKIEKYPNRIGTYKFLD